MGHWLADLQKSDLCLSGNEQSRPIRSLALLDQQYRHERTPAEPDDLRRLGEADLRLNHRVNSEADGGPF